MANKATRLVLRFEGEAIFVAEAGTDSPAGLTLKVATA